MPEQPGSARLWQSVWVRLAVALAFADASIVVLALPQIVDHLHTSISHVVWVIVAYNFALIAGAIVIMVVGDRLRGVHALVAGLLLFGLASVGCGAAGSLAVLVPLRCVQGFAGALILCSSLGLFGGFARAGESPLEGWSAAAAIGAAVGPAAGGILTELFSWRSIFFAQAPVAVLAAIAVLAVRGGASEAVHVEPVRSDSGRPDPRRLDPRTANVALTFLSAGLIGALFLVVIELINAWLVTPIGAAALVTTIPLATAGAERLARGRSPVLLGLAGSLLVALGLLCLAQLTHRELAVVVLALALCGAGLGLGFPGLTAAALRSAGSPAARAAKTIAARDAGLVLGLLLLTPVFVTQLNAAPADATRQAAGVILFAPLPLTTKAGLAAQLAGVVNAAPESSPPDVTPVFDRFAAGAGPSERIHLAQLEKQLQSIIERAATHPFRRPYLYAALLALLVVPLLVLQALLARTARVGRPAR